MWVRKEGNHGKLGHAVGEEGIKTDLDEIKVIAHLKISIYTNFSA